ncbi:non-structural maintenance of chromosomes element 4 homolog A-like [Pollicipes pollicipes]|uniref:non-structural maintenance of chromosomes element 4 homolog A-like n=1 Tax=Pollicipes pollicipes TaxID=41117 RepID=UPI0018853BB2|nr:non-structural maintenance of chromosomes element 4 homolog A-like [Pollicipes pollicipes]XP_037092522.1 non-structural maintenance of chromosomes element 4 homolog A-like [Pollicipes pollicipes]
MAEDRRLTSKYLEMRNELEEKRIELEEDVDTSLAYYQERMENLLVDSNHVPPPPNVLERDSENLVALSTIQRRRVEHCAVSFRPLEFAMRFCKYVSDGGASSMAPDVWGTIGQLSADSFFRPSPGLRVLRGRLPPPNMAPRERQQRQRRARSGPLAAVVSPDQVKASAHPESTRIQVDRLLQALKKLHSERQRPINFFKFAYHPTDFGATVENVFHTAFLVQKQLARVRLDGDGVPVIEPVTDQQRQDDNNKAGRHQLLMRVDHETWQRVVKAFNIQRPLVKPAAAADALQRSCDGAAPPTKRDRRS